MPDFIASYKFQFKGLVLHQALKSWSDKIAFRNAVHEYLKRAGAEIEPMRRKAAEFTFSCFFLGPTWQTQYKELLDSLDESNLGPLVHPLLGALPAACDLLSAQSTPGTGRNLVEFTLQFTENNVDSYLAAEGTPPPAEAIAKVAATAAALTAESKVAGLIQSAGKVRAFVARLGGYLEAATQAATQIAQNPSWQNVLTTLGQEAEVTIGAVLADPSIVTDCQAYEVLTLIEQCYAGALDVADAIDAVIPQPQQVTVQTGNSLINLCQRWYGGEKAVEAAEYIQTVNRVPNPSWIKAGTALRVPPIPKDAA